MVVFTAAEDNMEECCQKTATTVPMFNVLVQSTMVVLKSMTNRKILLLHCKQYYIEGGQRQKKLKVNVLSKSSLKVLHGTFFHMVMLTEVHNLIYGCTISTAMIFTVLNTAHADYNDDFTIARR